MADVDYHKGSLEVLFNERAELSRILQIVNALIEMHAKELEKKGIKLSDFVKELEKKQKQKFESKKDWSKDLENFDL